MLQEISHNIIFILSILKNISDLLVDDKEGKIMEDIDL